MGAERTIVSAEARKSATLDKRILFKGERKECVGKQLFGGNFGNGN